MNREVPHLVDLVGTEIRCLADLVGVPLDEFTIRRFTELYRVDEDGRRAKSIGFFKDPDVARATARGQVDSAYHQTREVPLLTNGVVAFLVGEQVTLIDEEAAKLTAIQAALLKLTPEELKLLGIIEDPNPQQ